MPRCNSTLELIAEQYYWHYERCMRRSANPRKRDALLRRAGWYRKQYERILALLPVNVEKAHA